MKTESRRLYRFGPFILNTAERVLLREAQVIRLTPKLFDTLLLLVENSGRVIEKERMVEALWPETYVGQTSLSQNITALRRLLGKYGEVDRYIETLPKRGYRFTAEVKEITSRGAAHLKRKLTLAVLPFGETGRVGETEHLGLGLTDALIGRLSTINQLIVRPFSTVSRYVRTEATDPVEAGRELRVEVVLSGSVAKRKERLRVRVELLSVSEGRVIWEGEFEAAALADIFSIKEEIATKVARALMLNLVREEQRQALRPQTASVEAYRAFNTGRYYWLHGTPEGLRKSLEWARRAVAIDPDYALAYVEIARSLIVFFMFGVASPHDSFPQAKVAVSRALSIDDRLAEAHSTLAFINLLYDWDAEAAGRGFERSLELEWNSAMTHFWYFGYFLAIGRLDEAITEIETALELYGVEDRLSLNMRANIGHVLYFQHKFDAAIEALKPVLEHNPEEISVRFLVSQALVQKGMAAEALALYEGQNPISNYYDLTGMGCAYAALGRREEALASIRKMKELSASVYMSPYYVAQVYAALGMKEEAYRLLRESVQERSPYMFCCLHVDPAFDSLRAEQPFIEIQEPLIHLRGEARGRHP